MKWDKLPEKEIVQRAIEALKKNGIDAEVVQSGKEAKERVFSSISDGAEIMNMTSVTLDSLGISKEIQESGKYEAVKNKLYAMDRKTQSKEMQKLGSAPEWSIGSAHAITEDGQIIIASNTGSQLPAYAYGSSKVLFVVGTQKVVKNLDDAFKRIYEHTLPLESERAKKAYGVPGSFVSKLLIINREITPGRIKVIFVNEVLGF